MYNTTDEHVDHLSKLQQVDIDKTFYEKIEKLRKGFKKVIKLSTSLLLRSNKLVDGSKPYTFGCID